jgi:hypothetical protein
VESNGCLLRDAEWTKQPHLLKKRCLTWGLHHSALREMVLVDLFERDDLDDNDHIV